MPRKAREISRTGVYHVMLRGVNRQEIFEEKADYLFLLWLIKKVKEKYFYEIYSKDKTPVLYELTEGDRSNVTMDNIFMALMRGEEPVKSLVDDIIAKFSCQSISQKETSCTTSSQKCKIKLPTITASDGYKVLGWALDKNSKKQEFNVSDTIEIDKDLVLYAIVSLNQTENYISMNEYKFPSVTSGTYRKKKVLVIEIDPYLSTKGKKTSEFLEQGGAADIIINNLRRN